jgi:hypothetical protein
VKVAAVTAWMMSSISTMSFYQQGRTRCDNQTPMNNSVECADVEFETRSLPNLLVATLATLPSMSLIPSGSILS